MKKRKKKKKFCKKFETTKQEILNFRLNIPFGGINFPNYLLNNANRTVASSEGPSGGESALFSKLAFFGGPNSPQKVIANVRGILANRLTGAIPDTGLLSILTFHFFFHLPFFTTNKVLKKKKFIFQNLCFF